MYPCTVINAELVHGTKQETLLPVTVTVRQTAMDLGVCVCVQSLAEEVSELLQGTSIYLVGMMGSGKSTVGRLVGKALKYPLLDTDALIEKSTRSTVSELFAEEGEDAFRDLETDVLQVQQRIACDLSQSVWLQRNATGLPRSEMLSCICLLRLTCCPPSVLEGCFYQSESLA